MPCRDIFLAVPVFVAPGRYCPTMRLSRTRTAITFTLLAAAILLGPTSATFAACVPPVFDEEGEEIEEIESGGTVTCTGVDANGVETSESNVTVNVIAGALVSGSARGIELGASIYTINNAGTIVGLGTTGVGDGIHVKFNAATINNSGSISGNTQDGVNLGASPTMSTTLTYSVINQAGGTITGAEAAVRLNRPGTVDNHGGLAGDTGITFRKVFAGEIDNFHTIMGTRRGINLDRSQNVIVTNHAGATISAGENGTGVLLGSNDDAEFTSSNLTFNNNGSVDSDGGGVELKSANSVVTNTSQIQSVKNGIGVLGANATLNNSGTNTAADKGFSISGANINLMNSGTVQGDEDGVKIQSVGGTINNTGMITSTAMDAIRFTGSTSGVTLNNSNMVMGARDGIRLDDFATGTMINNQAGGTISGDVVGIQILGSATNTTINNAAGTMINGIWGGNGTETIINLGNTSGDVLLAGGDDRFTLNETTGVFGGAVNGGDGMDTFAVVGVAGTANFNLFSMVSKFETVQIEADATFVMDPAESVEVDGLFTTLGGFTGNIGPSATVDLMGGGEFAGNTDFHIATNGELKFGGTTTFKSGASTFSGAGSVHATAITIDGGTVTNSISGAFTIAPNLAATGGQFINEGTLRFLAGNITGGEIDGVTLTNGLKNQAGAHITFEAPARLEGVMENNGTVLLIHPLTLFGGAVVNRSMLELGAFGQIQDGPAGVGLLESHFGTLKKSGGFISDIGAAFTSQDGEIAVTNGTLRLRGNTVFKGDNTVAISAGTSLELFNASTSVQGGFDFEVSGGGTLVVNTNKLELGEDSLFTSETAVIWSGDRIDGPGTIDFTRSFKIAGASAQILNTTLSAVGDTAHLTIAQSIDSSDDNGAIDNTFAGMISVDAPGQTLTVGLPLANQEKLKVAANTNVTFDHVAQLKFLNALGSRLSGGTWEVENGAVLELNNPASGAVTDIARIDAGAGVVLHGTGRVNNLPFQNNVHRFENAGTLELRDGVKMGSATVNGGVIMNRGEFLLDSTSSYETSVGGLTGWGGLDLATGTITERTFWARTGSKTTINGTMVLLLDDDPNGFASAHFEPGSILSGNGTINGHLVSEGHFNPGQSPGKLIVNGDYIQTASGVLEFEIGGSTTESYDQLIVNGTAIFEPGATVDVRFLPGTTIAAGTEFMFFDAETVTGDLSAVIFNIIGLADTALVELNIGGSELGLTALGEINTVPIPASLPLFSFAIAVLLRLRYRRYGSKG